VEVVGHDEATGAYLVASGFGEKADWYKNVMVHPDITIQVGRRQMAAHAERLPLPQATEVMLDYSRRHPATLRTLAGLLGYHSDGSEADVRFLAGVIPILALIPQDGK
jgi:deazaflavin-dependent oxidoreductase (nitroreductase family)